MPQIIIKVREGEEVREFLRETRRFKSPLKSLGYVDPFIERAKLASVVAEKIREIFDTKAFSRKLDKLVKAEWGRAYISKSVVEMVKKYGEERLDVISQETGEKIGEGVSKAKISMIRKELKELNKMKDITGKEYMKRINDILKKYLDERATGKIMNKIMLQIHEGEVGKNGIINPRVSVYQDGEKVRIENYDIRDREKINALAEKIGIKKSKLDYFKHKDSLLMIEALENGRSVEEAKEIYFRRFSEELQKDSLFREGFRDWCEKELIKAYNLGSLYGLFEKLITEYPAFLAGATARMLAHAAKRLPVLGDVAATQYEAAAAMTEIGEKLSEKVSSSARMWYNLRDAAPNLYEQVSRGIEA